MIRVLLAVDQAMVCRALAALLRLENDLELVAELASGEAVVPAALEPRPDVALLNIEMPGGDGLTAAAVLHEQLPACRAGCQSSSRSRAPSRSQWVAYRLKAAQPG